MFDHKTKAVNKLLFVCDDCHDEITVCDYCGEKFIEGTEIVCNWDTDDYQNHYHLLCYWELYQDDIEDSIKENNNE